MTSLHFQVFHSVYKTLCPDGLVTVVMEYRLNNRQESEDRIEQVQTWSGIHQPPVQCLSGAFPERKYLMIYCLIKQRQKLGV
jgi:hypothetical protein